MPGWIEIAVVLIILILLFGRGKISELMGDVAKGITSFKKGLKEDDKTLEAPAPEAAPEAASDAGADASMSVDASADESEQEKTDA